MESRRSAVIKLFNAGNSKSKIVKLLKTNKMFVFALCPVTVMQEALRTSLDPAGLGLQGHFP